jgi:hypothetical protein
MLSGLPAEPDDAEVVGLVPPPLLQAARGQASGGRDHEQRG